LKILFLGCGDIAQRTVAQLPDQYQCFGLKRNPENLPSAITPFKGDVSDYRQLQAVLGEHFDVLVATLTPDEFTEQAYRSAYLEAANSLQRALATIDRQPKWVIWVSSTSVYGDTRGAWVDEDSPTEPQTFSGRTLLAAEEVIQQLLGNHTLVRFSGIYGPGRTRMINQVLAGKGRPAEPEQWSNRIHSDDCAGVLTHLIGLLSEGEVPEPLYLASDSEPVTQHDLRRWLAIQLGVELQEEAANRGPIRRCSNRRLLRSGYQFKYPSYREGYRSLLSDEV
jgi:nucleoside-diphosphate-sugar epimerase